MSSDGDISGEWRTKKKHKSTAQPVVVKKPGKAKWLLNQNRSVPYSTPATTPLPPKDIASLQKSVQSKLDRFFKLNNNETHKDRSTSIKGSSILDKENHANKDLKDFRQGPVTYHKQKYNLNTSVRKHTKLTPESLDQFACLVPKECKDYTERMSVVQPDTYEENDRDLEEHDNVSETLEYTATFQNSVAEEFDRYFGNEWGSDDEEEKSGLKENREKVIIKDPKSEPLLEKEEHGTQEKRTDSSLASFQYTQWAQDQLNMLKPFQSHPSSGYDDSECEHVRTTNSSEHTQDQDHTCGPVGLLPEANSDRDSLHTSISGEVERTDSQSSPDKYLSTQGSSVPESVGEQDECSQQSDSESQSFQFTQWAQGQLQLLKPF